jgi:hypothetical protein
MNRLSDAGARLRPCGTTIVTEPAPDTCRPFWGGAAFRQRGMDPAPTAFHPRRKPAESALAGGSAASRRHGDDRYG